MLRSGGFGAESSPSTCCCVSSRTLLSPSEPLKHGHHMEPTPRGYCEHYIELEALPPVLVCGRHWINAELVFYDREH